MKSKQIFLLTIILWLSTSVYALGQQKTSFTASGYIKGLGDQEIYLGFGTFKKMKADTVHAVDGHFIFSDSITEPCYGMLFTHDYSVKVDLLVDKGNIHITGNIDSISDLKVSGSPAVNQYAAYNHAVMQTRKPVQVLYERWMEAYKAGDSTLTRSAKASFSKARDQQSAQARQLKINFIKTHPGNYASAWELIHFINIKTLQQGKTIYKALTPEVRHSKLGKEVQQRIATLSRVAVGQKAPGFSQKDVTGDPVTLDSYRGKYVLLEFWASWCGPCRAESPNIVKAYKKYKDKGFDVLSVSLDDEKDKWIEAIRHDNLSWTHVCDLKGWKNEVGVLYGIHAVPANFLIDPTGTIVARNLRGSDLNKKLAQIFRTE